MSQKTSNLDQIQESIHPWKVTFINQELEEQYMKWNWDKAYNRYRLLFIFGFLMVLTDPTIYQKDPLAALIEGLVTILIFSFPILLRKSSFFQKHHDLCSALAFVLIGFVGTIGMFASEEIAELNETFFAVVPAFLVVLIYTLFPFRMLAAAFVALLGCCMHYTIGGLFVDTSTLTLEYWLTSVGFIVMIYIMMSIYHREMEFSRRSLFLQMRLLDQKNQNIRDTFKSYMGGSIGESILSDSMQERGEDRWVSILFTDLRGYSTIIEPMSPKQVLTLLNDYFSQMHDIIEKHDGVVLEYIGDAMMIVFGAPNEVEDHQVKAVQCAMEMREHLKQLNIIWHEKGFARFWKNQDIDTLVARAGIHTGNIVAGNIGSSKKMKYGVIGDVVNIAARLEQANKQFDTDILFSRSVYVALPEELIAHVQEQGTTNLKGRAQEERVYSI